MHNVILFIPKRSQGEIDLTLIRQAEVIGYINLPSPDRHTVTALGGQEYKHDDLNGRIIKCD